MAEDGEAETVTYTYGNTNWKDQLTKYNNKEITYDAIGNPLTYDGNTYTWQNGRQLSGITNQEDNLTITYKYNDNGTRTEKTVNGTTTKYYLNGDKVIYEKTGDNVIYYSYDESGELIGLTYNNQQYYYKKNLQGDIIGILDNELNEVVRYTYDSWGKVLTVTDGQGEPITDQNNIAHINPYRYRGYRYDKETDLYYLQSRYYNPEWGRFVNADALVSTGQGILAHNMYAYCNNNPINMEDSSGNISRATVKKFVNNCIKTVKKVVSRVVNKVKSVIKRKATTKKQKYPDYSKELNRVIQKNSKVNLRLSGISSLGLPMFYQLVKPKGDWDYKLEDNWNREIHEPFLGYNGKFLYNGRVTTAEEFGNINYGFVGAANGIPDIMLYIGGGFAARGIHADILKGPYYGDSKEDHYSIKRGIEMYWDSN